MEAPSSHAKGLIIVILGVLLLTPDALLIRLMGLDHWNVLFWRGLAQTVGLTGIVLLLHGRGAPAVFRAVGRRGLFAALVIGTSTLLFVIALSHTTVANVLFIMAAAPFFAALTSRAALGERIAARTWLAIAAALAGIGLLGLEGLGRGSLLGDLAALGAAVSMGGSFTVLRHARGTNMMPAMAISGLAVAAVATVVGPDVVLSQRQALLVLAMAVIVPVSFALVITGPRFLPAAEVSLLVQLEAVLGPLWVWLVIGEAPGHWALVGGAVVIAALTTHSILTLRSGALAAP